MKLRMACVAALATAMALPVAAQTVDEVIAKSIAARGGMDKLKSVQTLRETGRVLVGPGIEAPFTFEFRRPMQVRVDVVVQGITATVQAYDGKVGWQFIPFQGQQSAEALSADELKDVQEEADLDGPLVDYKVKGHQVELAGKEDVEGTSCYKVKITLKNGDIRYDYIDTDSYLELKQTGKRKINGADMDIETSLGDYKPVEGLMVPFSIDSGAQGSQQHQKIITEKVEINVPIDSSRFAMPAAAPPKPAEAKPPVAAQR